MSNIRTKPVSLNESTLETNIASEIASLFNSPFNIGYPFRLRWLLEFDRINLNVFRKRKTRLYRLTPIEENKGGGWDTMISIPKGKNDSRAIFIQFKSGKHSEGNEIAESIFNRFEKNPNPNAEFEFNNNKSKNPEKSNNQHETLKNLSDNLIEKGFSSKSVMYAFPRITTLDQFKNMEEDLLLHTTFLTINEIEEEAKKEGVNLNDRSVHHFRTCYIEENRREIASEVLELKKSDTIENVLYEIFLVKLAHIRNQFPKGINKKNFNDEIFLMLAEYLKLNPFDYIRLDDYYPQPSIEEIGNYFIQLVEERQNDFKEIFEIGNLEGNPFLWREKLFKRIVNFFEANDSDKIDIQSEIPSDYTFNLSNEKEYIFDLKNEFDISLLVF